MWCWRRIVKISWADDVRNETGKGYPTNNKKGRLTGLVTSGEGTAF
jgi:hypothetical protein